MLNHHYSIIVNHLRICPCRICVDRISDIDLEESKMSGEGTMSIVANKVAVNKNIEIAEGVKFTIERK